MIYLNSNLWKHLLSLTFKLVGNERGEVGGEDEGDDDGKGADDEASQQLSTLKTELESAKRELESSKTEKSSLEQKLEEADKELLSDDYLEWKDTRGKSKTTSPSSDLDVDLDRASNREIAGFIEKKYKGDLDAAVKDIRKELDASKQQMGIIAAQFDVALTSIRHDGQDGKPSWAGNEKAIFEIAKANPRWDAEKCYQQFVLESKAKSDRDEEEKKKKAEEEEKAATERTGVPPSTTKGKQLSKEEAADLAFRKAFGNKE
jgi:hypothetical protein